MSTGTNRGPAVLVGIFLMVAGLVALVLWALCDDAPAPPPDVPKPAPFATTKAPAKKPKPRPPMTIAEAPPPIVEPPEPGDLARPARTTTALQRAIKLHVVVRRSGGGPASGAEVAALDPLGEHLTPPGPVVRERKTADGDGRAEFAVAGGTTVLRVLASLEGEAALSDSVDVGGGDERTVELDLKPARAITVRVQQADGAPAGAAAVRMIRFATSESWPLPFAAVADADGVARFPPVPDVGTTSRDGWLVEASAVGQGRASRWLRGFEARNHPEVVLQLAMTAGVRGRCVNEAGAPVAGARIQLSGDDEFTMSGPDGRFAISGLTEGGAILVAKAPDLAPGVVRDLRGDAGDVDVGDVLLKVGGSIRGTVVGADGLPIARALVIAQPEGVTGISTGIEATDEKGRFEMAHVGDGPYVVEAQEPRDSGRASWTSIRRAAQHDVVVGADVRLVLDGAASVHVRFLNEIDRTPVAVTSVKLTATATGSTPDEAAWAWSGGGIDTVRFKPDHTGIFDVTVEVPGYDPGVAKAVEVAADRETRIEVVFRKTVK